MKFLKSISGIFLALVISGFFYTSVLAEEVKVSFAAKGEAGWADELKFTLHRADFWLAMPNGDKPRNDFFVVLFADIEAVDRRSCLYKRNYDLRIGETIWKTPEGSKEDSVESAYMPIEYPVPIAGVCANANTSKQIFLWFDVAVSKGEVILHLDGGGEIKVADSLVSVLGSQPDMALVLTPTPTMTSTRTPTPTAIPSATFTPTPKKTNTPVADPQSPILATETGIVTTNSNLRAGPGTDYQIVGKATTGQLVTIVGTNSDGTWYELDSANWIAAFLVTKNAATTVTAQQIREDQAATVYLLELAEIIDLYAESSGILSDRFTVLGSQPTLLVHEDWRVSVSIGIWGLQTAAKLIHELEPPPAYLNAMHQDMLSLADHIERGASLLIEAIDELNKNKLERAVIEVNAATTAMNAAQTKLAAFQ